MKFTLVLCVLYLVQVGLFNKNPSACNPCLANFVKVLKDGQIQNVLVLKPLGMNIDQGYYDSGLWDDQHRGVFRHGSDETKPKAQREGFPFGFGLGK